MNCETLRKLNTILRRKWHEIGEKNAKKAGSSDSSRHITPAHAQWYETCKSLGIEKLPQFGESEFDHAGEILEESIVLMDPSFYAAWLEIPNETAEKILVMGMP